MVDEDGGRDRSQPQASDEPSQTRGREHFRPSGAEKAAAWVTAGFVGALVTTLIVQAFASGNTTGVNNAPVGVFVALFGVLVTGVFVFATFRIDRGAKLEAHETARDVAQSVAREIGAKAAEEARSEANKAAKQVAAEAVARVRGEAGEAARSIATKASEEFKNIARSTATATAKQAAEEVAKRTAQTIARGAADDARKVARSVADDVANRTARKVAQDTARHQAETTAREVAEERVNWIFDTISSGFRRGQSEGSPVKGSEDRVD